MKKIYLAAGCFWGTEAYFKRVNGVEGTKVGYANGRTEETSYEELRLTDHTETCLIEYDESKISLEGILERYFSIIDPTSVNRQGGDTGRQYRTGIYYLDNESKIIAENAIKDLQNKFTAKIAVELEPLKNFVVAEEYHQDYLTKNPNGYCHIDISKVY